MTTDDIFNRYTALRARLRLTVPEVAQLTGYSAGYVSRWSHRGASALAVPPTVVDWLEDALRDRVRDDVAFLED